MNVDLRQAFDIINQENLFIKTYYYDTRSVVHEQFKFKVLSTADSSSRKELAHANSSLAYITYGVLGPILSRYQKMMLT
jgi:hypothetical protein